MKKFLLLLVCLSLCMTLSACGGNNRISGEVVEATPTALILEMNNGKQVAVLLEEHTHIFGIDGMDGDSYKAAPHTGVRVTFFHAGRAGTVTTADGKRVKAYHADLSIKIDAYLIPQAAVLSDGTVLDVWKESQLGSTYQTQDGIALLREDGPSGPENNYIEGLESFDDLSEEAKLSVAEFFESQGKLYDLQAELERAWAAYQEDPRDFSTFLVQQRSYRCATSVWLCYFETNLIKTVSGNNVQETTRCDAFHRNYGHHIPLAEVFACPEKDIGRKLLDIAAKECAIPSDSVVRAEMEAAFRPEYITVFPDSLWIHFPQGSLPSQPYRYLVAIPYSGECQYLMHDWAVPYSNAE